GTTALAAALGALVVVLPNGSTHFVAKRIALGRIVLIYVVGYINGAEPDPVMHPLRVAASTGLGVIACVLALLVPLPRLATCEVPSFSIYTRINTRNFRIYAYKAHIFIFLRSGSTMVSIIVFQTPIIYLCLHMK